MKRLGGFPYIPPSGEIHFGVSDEIEGRDRCHENAKAGMAKEIAEYAAKCK